MNDKAKPDWNCLPQDPLRFFGLSPDFERRDLKRAYGKMIRQFKPETHPAEFQKIRAGYEQLESANRYGMQQSLAEAQNDAWSDIFASSQNAENKSQPLSQEATRSMVDRAIENPKETYQELSESTQRTPQDYFLLAVLSDLFDKGQRTFFLKWIISGLKKFPQDRGLQTLLVNYLAQDVSDTQAAGVLSALAKILDGQDFFRLTESLWDRVLEKASFDDFARLLEKCKQSIRRESPVHLAAFNIHLLKQAIWKAPVAWVQEIYSSVSSMGVELDYRFGNELEFIEALVEYHSSRKNIKDDTVLKRIDQMIQDYCGSNFQRGAYTAAQVMDELGRSSFGMMKAFPNGDDSLERNVLILCHIIANDVENMVGLEPKKVSKKRLAQQSSQTVRDLRESLGPAMKKINRMHTRMRFVYIVCPALVPVFLFWGSLAFWPLFGLASVAMVLAVCVYRFFLLPTFLQEKLDAKQQHIFQSVYDAVWRPRLFRFIQSTGVGLDTAMGKLHESAADSDDSTWLSAVLSYSYSDGGLAFFARSQLFVG